jgi:cold shock CspA family protein/ribosome-associated translation inhibitor RaiA
MQLPLTISFRNMKRSLWIEREVYDRVAKLEELFARIMACRVVIEMPHKRHQQGNFYNVRIDLTVPGRQIVVNREAPKHASAEDFRAVLREAFEAARRQLHDYSRRRKHMVKNHVERPRGRVTRLFPEGYGFIETVDGREVYFHSNSVINQNFSNLRVQDEVSFEEEEGEKGAQASTVRVIEALGTVAS